ncbi:MAG TPA: serine/threonine-protein kinase, partial [Gemmatimonadales bacterium]|nr:serine/threonine-protein kinase [Gemmatimonadales bacterium]
MLDRLRAALAPGIAVERELARGGMGIVALGRDTLLDRPVAIKVLKPELATATSSERFLREARHAASLRHPNVVQVHHAGEADGLLYYTMDYVTGPTLAARLENGPLAAREAVRLGVDLLAALGAAHRQKLIHRDVKPSNIFLDCGRALLGDFGVAYALDTSSTELTRPGQPVGTLAYISPEQLRDQPVTERTDVYALGLVLYEASSGRRWPPVTQPSRGDWTLVPRHLRGPIRRALAVEPEDRWANAGVFAEALASAERRWRLRAGAGTLAMAGLAGALVAAAMIWNGRGSETGIERDLAVFPFTSADSVLGRHLAGLTGWSLEQVQGLTLVPRQTAFRTWRGSDLSPQRRLVALTGARTRSRYGAWALVRPRGDLLEVQVRVVDATGAPVFERTVAGPAAYPAALADSVARVITRGVFARYNRRERRAAILASVHPEAVAEFLSGEEALARDAWMTAERHYDRAFQLDSGFVLAAWRLGNVRRWLPLRHGATYPPGFFQLYQRHPERVPPVDARLIEAQFQRTDAARFEHYDRALLVAGDDPYAPLLYGDELFHRGPLAGRPMRDAMDMLQRAIETDSTLAPAWEHLAWALVRSGEGERAGVALAHLERWSPRKEEAGIHLPDFIRMAYVFRFGDARAQGEVAAGLGQSVDHLALAARGAMTFDLPAAQATLGAALAAASAATPTQRASGLVGRGVALMALGRVSEGLGALDSAALVFPSPREARLQAAEWRVVPPSLHAPGWSERERERGRAALRAMTGDPVLRSRAYWALAMDAHARGDSVEVRRYGEAIRASGGHRALAWMLEGMGHAAGGDWKAALAVTEPALAYDSAGYAPDPFLRAALHLERGEWLEHLGQNADADRSWLWYENLDLRAWPEAEAQPAEVDWALATYARARRARLALENGDRPHGCG